MRNISRSPGTLSVSLWIYISDVTRTESGQISVQPWFESSALQGTQRQQSKRFGFCEENTSSKSVEMDSQFLEKWICLMERMFGANSNDLAGILHRFPVLQLPSTWTSRFWNRCLETMKGNSKAAFNDYLIVTLASASNFANQDDDTVFYRVRLDIEASSSDDLLDTAFSIALHKSQKLSWNQTLLLQEPQHNQGNLYVVITVECLNNQDHSSHRKHIAKIDVSKMQDRVAFPLQVVWMENDKSLQSSPCLSLVLEKVQPGRPDDVNDQVLSVLPRKLACNITTEVQRHEDVEMSTVIVPPSLMEHLTDEREWLSIQFPGHAIPASTQTEQSDSVSIHSETPKTKKRFTFKGLFGGKSKNAAEKKHRTSESIEEWSHREILKGLHSLTISPKEVLVVENSSFIVSPLCDKVENVRDFFTRDKLGSGALLSSLSGSYAKESNSRKPYNNGAEGSNREFAWVQNKWNRVNQLSIPTSTHPASAGLYSAARWDLQSGSSESPDHKQLQGWGLVFTVRRKVVEDPHNNDSSLPKLTSTSSFSCLSRQKIKAIHQMENVESIPLPTQVQDGIFRIGSGSLTLFYDIEDLRQLTLTELFANDRTDFATKQAEIRDYLHWPVPSKTAAEQYVNEHQPLFRGVLKFSGSNGQSAEKTKSIIEMPISDLAAGTEVSVPLYEIFPDGLVHSNFSHKLTMVADVKVSQNRDLNDLWDTAMKDAHADLSQAIEENVRYSSPQELDESPREEETEGYGLSITGTCSVRIMDGMEPTIPELKNAVAEGGAEIRTLRQKLRNIQRQKEKADRELEEMKERGKATKREEMNKVNDMINELVNCSDRAVAVNELMDEDTLRKCLLTLSERYNAEKKTRKQLQERLLATELDSRSNQDRDGDSEDADPYSSLLAKYQELEEAHTAQNEQLRKQQKQFAVIDEYRTTIRTQEKIIEKLQQWISTKMKSKASDTAPEVPKHGPEDSDVLQASLRQMEDTISIKDQRIQLLEERLERNARDFAKELSQMKTKLRDAGLSD